MKQLFAQLKREFLEYRASFFYCALDYYISGYFTHTMLIPDLHINRLNIQSLVNFANEDKAIFIYFFSLATPFLVVVFFVQLNYFSHTLFYDRKDRTVLFWASMPVSEFKSIFAKYLFGIVLLPAFYFLCTFATGIVLLFYISFKFSFESSIVVEFSKIFIAFLEVFLSFVYINFWLFPIFSWALLCSAYARRSPLVMAFFFPFSFYVL